MMLGRWSKEWPTEEGFYWYYGYPFDSIVVVGGFNAELTIAKIYKEESIDCLLCTLFENGVSLYQKKPDGEENGRPFGVFYHRKINPPGGFYHLPPQDFFDKNLKEKLVSFHKKEHEGKEFELRRARETVRQLEQWLAERKEIDKVTSGG